MKIGTKSILLSLLGVTIMLSGCASNKSSNDILNRFETNDYTIHSNTKVEETKSNQSSSNKDTNENTSNSSNNTSQNVENAMGELILENTDNSIAYEVVNNTDVTYKGTTYVNLYACINSLNTKYDKNTVINFIIKNIKMTSKEIYCDLTVDDGVESADDISIDEELYGREKYEELKSKYNESATWSLTLTNSTDRTFRVIFGSYSYMLLSGVDGDVTLDMSKQDSGININETNAVEGSTEESVESTETEVVQTEAIDEEQSN